MTLGVLTSCGDDTVSNVTLSGQWVGVMSISYDAQKEDGNFVTCIAEQSHVYFNKSSNKFATAGSGMQIDDYPYGPYSQKYRTFTWTLDKSTAPATATIIYSDGTTYTLVDPGISNDGSQFGGYLDYGTGGRDIVYLDYDNAFNWSTAATEDVERPNWEDAYEEYMKEIMTPSSDTSM